MSAIALYGGYWPFPRLRWLRVARCAFSVELRSWGRFDCSLRAPAGLSPFDLAPDAIVGIVAPPLPAFAGVVEEVAEDPERGAVRVSGREYAAVLSDRLTPQSLSWPSGDAGLIAEEEVRRANARNPTGLQVASAQRGAILAQPIQANGEDLQSFLERLSELTGYEWEFRYRAGEQLRVTWQWRSRAGEDLRTAVHLVALSEAEYGRRLAGRSLLTRAVGGVAEFRDRPSHVRVRGGSAPFHNRLARTVESEPTRAAATSVLHAPEADILDPQAATARAVAALTRGALEQPWIFEEQVEFSLPLGAWPSGLRVGSTVGLRLAAARFGRGVVRPCRILGYEADLERGIVSVIGGLEDA